EVGIRKVLGASVYQIVLLFYQEFIILVLVSAAVGIPIVYVGMSQWLSSYAFKIDFPWAAALLSAAIVLVFALMAVGYQTYKVAVLNPAKTIKDE
ncbi:MAG: FtsX-like permease family protein, partial [Ekhidna sp.]|nr:FtsX-like permease family protein [Ekhidna sp.]